MIVLIAFVLTLLSGWLAHVASTTQSLTVRALALLFLSGTVTGLLACLGLEMVKG